tara:strand:+ start:24955 stop:25953 length:999 start_codon:yes stop_codon:yes gene_type:complete
MYKIGHLILSSILIFILLTPNDVRANQSFDSWLTEFKIKAKNSGISDDTIKLALSDVKYLEKVIGYDRKQPEFFEKTSVYISKRASKRAMKEAKRKYKNNFNLFNKIEKEFKIEKEILLALWGIETNFGNYLGKMDILSSLATLSFDKRRSEFFTEQLLILLNLMDKKIVSKDMLYGSWAGAMGNFQFMPSTIKNYGIDYDGDGKIDLKKSYSDSIASAANYLSKVGWKFDGRCFMQVDVKKKIKKNLINSSARNIKNRKNNKYWYIKGVTNLNKEKLQEFDSKAALVYPDGNNDSPKYLVFHNYEKILKWNRSLRFALSVCTLAKMIENEI